MATASTPQLATTGSASVTVTSTDLASSISADSQDEFPTVFATSRLVALMEIAAARVLKPHLGQGQLSVGVTIDISHTAPTPTGTVVTAEAKFIGMEGKLFLFEVTATDAGGQIGKGTHKRAIVDSARLESTAKKRNTAQEAL